MYVLPVLSIPLDIFMHFNIRVAYDFFLLKITRLFNAKRKIFFGVDSTEMVICFKTNVHVCSKEMFMFFMCFI